mgnify:CR=1 FL=1
MFLYYNPLRNVFFDVRSGIMHYIIRYETFFLMFVAEFDDVFVYSQYQIKTRRICVRL